jgi:nucleotide-binding universal stress UspA family protein
VTPQVDRLQPRPVVVGIDGSDGALAAARFGREEARRRSAPLHLVIAVPHPPERLTARLPRGEVPELLRRGGEATARATVDVLAPAMGDVVAVPRVVTGRAVDVLCAASAGAQLIVLGGRGIGGLPGLLLGSTAAGVVAQASCPVVVLPGESDVLVHGRRTVVVGVEGRSDEDGVLAFAFDAAVGRGTDLLAVHAWQEIDLDAPLRTPHPLTDWQGAIADEERVLAEALAGWRSKEPDVDVREAVVRERTAPALVAAAMTAQLLVVGHRAGRYLGSTTQGVLNRASCPIAVVPIDAEADR